MANPYPISIQAGDVEGPVTTVGELTFTDNSNQPGGGAWGEASGAALVGSGSPVGVVAPTGIGDLYVDETTPALWQANGLTNTDWQLVGGGGGGTSGALAPVVVASADASEVTATPPSGAATIDGVAVATGNRVLLTAQSVPADNGVWVVDTAGAWTRPTDWADGATVVDGTIIATGSNGFFLWQSVWITYAQTATVIGTDSVTFTMIAGATIMQSAFAGSANPALSIAASSLKVVAAELGVFNTAPAIRPTVTGSLSTVVDPAVQDILTSLIAALDASAVGLVVDGTT